MPNGMRSSLVALVICTGFAAQAAGEPGTTWTDPPARKPETAKAEPRPAAAPLPAAVSTPVRKEANVVRRKPVAPHRIASRRHRAPVTQVAHRTPHRVSRMATLAPAGPIGRRYAYPVYTDAAFPPRYEDERLDRLRTAVDSGYLVVHRRTVEYPDGRVIRYYRPADDDGME